MGWTPFSTLGRSTRLPSNASIGQPSRPPPRAGKRCRDGQDDKRNELQRPFGDEARYWEKRNEAISPIALFVRKLCVREDWPSLRGCDNVGCLTCISCGLSVRLEPDCDA